MEDETRIRRGSPLFFIGRVVASISFRALERITMLNFGSVARRIDKEKPRVSPL